MKPCLPSAALDAARFHSLRRCAAAVWPLGELARSQHEYLPLARIDAMLSRIHSAGCLAEMLSATSDYPLFGPSHVTIALPMKVVETLLEHSGGSGYLGCTYRLPQQRRDSLGSGAP